ncbi:MAG: MFS transporter [Pseudomonadota bacterium]|nr:MFS transporter [Pseudomonadota bacterium]
MSAAGAAGAWAPLRHREYAILWGAGLVANTGNWMYDLAARWLMTEFDSSASMVALVQVASALPVFLLAVPAGTLADRCDRRWLLIIVQATMLLLALLMGLLVLGKLAGPVNLLLVTLAMGSCVAVMSPTWQAIVPALVTREDLPQAIALHAMSMNISRAIGPALAGVVIAGIGIAWPFLINALTFVAVIAALWMWRGYRRVVAVHKESYLAALRTGLAQARDNAALRRTLWRSVLFYVNGSCYWALLPLIARGQLQGGPGLFGVLVGCIGAGAVAGALFLPALRARVGIDRVQQIGQLATAIALLGFALLRIPVLGMVAALLAGAAWLASLSSLNVAAQLAMSEPLRARGMALYTAVFYGCLAGGSLLWGQVATAAGVTAALLAAAVLALAALAPARHLPIGARAQA